MTPDKTMTTTLLEERLLRFAEEARAAAERTSPGREQDVLLQKARKAKYIAGAARRLKV